MKFFTSVFFTAILLASLSGCQTELEPEITRPPKTPTFAASPSPALDEDTVLLPTLTPTVLTSPTSIPTITPSVIPIVPTPSSVLVTPEPLPVPTGWGCASDASVDPCHRPFFDIVMLSDTEGWMVGGGGAIFRWNGTEWQPWASPVIAHLTKIYALNSQDIWVSGFIQPDENSITGVFLHWDGSSWVVVPTLEPFQSILSMSFVNENAGWAIDEEYDANFNITSYFMRWDGTTWTKIQATERLTAVHMLSSTDGWASAEFSSLYRWDGQSWELADETIWGEGLHGIGSGPHEMLFTSPNEGWLINGSGGVIHWDGSQWQNDVQPIGVNVDDVTLLDQEVWAVGYINEVNYLLHWDGQNWLSMDGPPEGRIRGLAVFAEDDIWAVGHTNLLTSIMWHWDGNTWASHHLAPIAPPINAFAMVSENEAWGVGDAGYISYWDGQNWVEFASPTLNDLNGVDFIAPDNGWAVGDHTTILHWDGQMWSTFRETADPPYASVELQDVAFVSSTEIWIAGGVNSEGGTGPALIHLQWDGQTWQELDPKTPFCECYFYSIVMLSSIDGWVVGGGGLNEASTVHWDGTTWQIVPNPGNYWLYSVAALATDEVWAEGVQQSTGSGLPRITMRWDGQEWHKELPTRSSPDIPLVTAEEWLKGKWILERFYWNGASWAAIQNMTWQDILDADMTPSGKIVVFARTGVWLTLEE